MGKSKKSQRKMRKLGKPQKAKHLKYQAYQGVFDARDDAVSAGIYAQWKMDNLGDCADCCYCASKGYPVGAKVWFANHHSAIEYLEVQGNVGYSGYFKGLDYDRDGEHFEAFKPLKSYRFWDHVHPTYEAALAYSKADFENVQPHRIDLPNIDVYNSDEKEERRRLHKSWENMTAIRNTKY